MEHDHETAWRHAQGLDGSWADERLVHSRPSSPWKVAGVTLLGGAIVAGLLMLAWPVWAHQAPSGWSYPFMCCADRDCTMLPKGAVKETPMGFVVTVLPGQHDFVKSPVQFLIPYGQEKISPDGADHICLSPELKVLCFFSPSRGF